MRCIRLSRSISAAAASTTVTANSKLSTYKSKMSLEPCSQMPDFAINPDPDLQYVCRIDPNRLIRAYLVGVMQSCRQVL